MRRGLGEHAVSRLTRILIILALVLTVLHPWLVLAVELPALIVLAVVIARAAGGRPRLIVVWRL
jgi:hypothetical protein